jgi:hypothetical protein
MLLLAFSQKSVTFADPAEPPTGVRRTLPRQINPMESHPYAMRARKAPGITSLRKTGEGVVALISTRPFDECTSGRGVGTSVLAALALPGGTDMPLSTAVRSDKM